LSSAPRRCRALGGGARKIAGHLAQSDRPMSGFALSWVLANKLISGVVIGPKSMAQLEDYLAVAGTPYDEVDEAFMNTLIPPGASAGYAYADPRYPYRGRVFESWDDGICARCCYSGSRPCAPSKTPAR
jgi:hypothetical protein